MCLYKVFIKFLCILKLGCKYNKNLLIVYLKGGFRWYNMWLYIGIWGFVIIKVWLLLVRKCVVLWVELKLWLCWNFEFFV